MNRKSKDTEQKLVQSSDSKSPNNSLIRAKKETETSSSKSIKPSSEKMGMKKKSEDDIEQKAVRNSVSKSAKQNNKSPVSVKKERKTSSSSSRGSSSKNIHSEKAVHASQSKVPEAFLADLHILGKIFAANPGIIEPIRDVFEYHLIEPIDRKTFPRMVNALSILLSPAPAMVILTGCHVNLVSFFEDLLGAVEENNTEDRTAIMLIQQLTSIYGNHVQKAYSLASGTMDEDWHTIDINTYKREGESPVWMIDMRLSQYDGSKIHMKMTPDSAFQIVDIIMAELLTNVPIEQVDSDLISRCRQHCKEFYEKYYGKLKSKTGDEEHPAGYA